MNRTRLNALLTFLTTFLTGLRDGPAPLVGRELAISGQLTPGELVQFYSYVACSTGRSRASPI